MSNSAVPLRPVKKGTLTRLWLGVAAIAAIGGVAAWATTAPVIAKAGNAEQFLAWHKRQPGVQETASGLQYQIVKKGEGASPTDSDVALVNYVGTLRDGKQFDKGDKSPFPVNGVVPGFSEGLKLMTKGSKYRLWIKPELAYGDKDQGNGLIPANSLLIFDVELLDFIPAAVLQQMQLQQQLQQGAPPQGAMPPPR